MVQPKNVLIEKSVIIENATSFFFFLALIVKPRFWYVVIAIELCPNFKRSVRFTERKRENLLKKRKQTNRVCVETIKMQEFPEIRLHYGKNALSNEKLFYAMRNETIRCDVNWERVICMFSALVVLLLAGAKVQAISQYDSVSCKTSHSHLQRHWN